MAGVTEIGLPKGSILTHVRRVLIPRERCRHFRLSLSLAEGTCRFSHPGSSPGAASFGSEQLGPASGPWHGASSQGHSGHRPATEALTPCPAVASVTSWPAQSCPEALPLPPLCCYVCRESGSFPKTENSFPFQNSFPFGLPQAKRPGAQARSSVLATTCHGVKSTFCHSAQTQAAPFLVSSLPSTQFSLSSSRGSQTDDKHP